MTTKDILNKITVALDDINFNKIQRYEYIKYIEETLQDIALECNLYLDKMELIGKDGETSVEISYENKQPIAIEHVARNGFVCREFSSNAIKNAQVDLGNTGFSTNATILNERAYCIIVEGTKQKQLKLEFAVPFHGEEKIEVLLSTTISSDKIPTEYKDPVDVPAYLYNCLYYGVMTRVLETMSLRNEKRYSEYPVFKSNYDREKKKVKAYLVNLKSKAGLNLIQPLLWLSESNYRDGQVKEYEFPPEYTSTIIQWE